MLGIVTSIEVHARVADGDDVITRFALHTSVALPTPTAPTPPHPGGANHPDPGGS